jgi:FkbM family methyltransferase
LRAKARRLAEVLRLSGLVRERARFALRELSRRRLLAVYRPRAARVRVCVRHNYPEPGAGSYDHFPLYEVFGERCYEPPPVVDAVLRGTHEPRIVDLGGHLGYFGAFVLSRYPTAGVLAFEPEPMHARLLRKTIALNGLEGRWKLIEACAHTNDGVLAFATGRSIGSHLVSVGAEEQDVVELPARDVFPHLDGADLLKIDIEGAEWALLFDERFASARPPAVVMEYHSNGCPGENPKQVARDRFRELGYRAGSPDDNPETGPFWGRGLMWAWLEPTAAAR